MKVLLSGEGELAEAILDFLIQLEWIELLGFVGNKRNATATRAIEHGATCFAPRRAQQTGADIFIAAEDPADYHADWAMTARLSGLHLHLSLLPRHRGSAPIRWALLDGDEHCGATVHYITPTAWDGNVLAQEKREIKGGDSAITLQADLIDDARSMLIKVMHALAKIGPLPGTPQKLKDATFRDSPPDNHFAALDFAASAEAVQRRVQAFCHPFGGARARLQGLPIAIWQAVALPLKPNPKLGQDQLTAADFTGDKHPGAVLTGPEGRIAVRCGVSVLELQSLQRDPESGHHPDNNVAAVLAGAIQLDSASS
jgi:methionyl-tRNA formyltransferase